MIIIKQLPPSDIVRIAEIDRSERVTKGYTYQDGKLIGAAVDWDVPTWSADRDGDHSIARNIRDWSKYFKQDSDLLGALDGERLAGFAVLRYKLTDVMAQLAVLHISRSYRRQGVATQLVETCYRLARTDGAQTMYVSATPSGSAVGFYLDQGFKPTNQPDPELLALEPEDIHMIKVL